MDFICTRYLNYSTGQCKSAGTAVTLAPWPFLIFCATTCSIIQQPQTLNSVHYLAHQDVSKITWFQQIMAPMPRSDNEITRNIMSLTSVCFCVCCLSINIICFYICIPVCLAQLKLELEITLWMFFQHCHNTALNVSERMDTRLCKNIFTFENIEESHKV
jgi:hypothetical protein